MIDLITFILHRALSGKKNGEGYANHKGLMLIFTFLTNVTPPIWAALTGREWYFVIALAVFGIAPIIVAAGFFLNYKWIHAFEVITTGAFVVVAFLSNADIIALLVSVPFGGVLFKGFVNLGSKMPFIDRQEVTNDATGKTFNLWLFGKELKIPRVSNGYTRLYIGIGMLGLYILKMLVIPAPFTFYVILKWVGF